MELDKDAKRVIGAVAELVVQDARDNNELRVRLARSIGYSDGKKIGYIQGYADAQREAQGALANLLQSIGLTQEEGTE